MKSVKHIVRIARNSNVPYTYVPLCPKCQGGNWVNPTCETCYGKQVREALAEGRDIYGYKEQAALYERKEDFGDHGE